MKKLLILSGKGGTGKTTLASAFIKLAHVKAYADCDVDAPNLHLVLNQISEPKVTDFYGLAKAQIDQSKCTECDICKQNCHFDAINKTIGYIVNDFACEGCGVCAAICPSGAVILKPVISGELQLYMQDAVFCTAKLRMGSGASGKLVSDVKKQMINTAKNVEFAVIDGSPGIGCPVISSMSGVDMVLIVAEPTVSGISDLKRILKTAGVFGVSAAVCINKYDTNIDNASEIESYCKKEGIPFVGRIPYDTDAVKAINSGKTIVDINCASGLAATNVFNETIKYLFQ